MGKEIKFRALTEVQPHLGFKYGYFYEEWDYGKPSRALIRDKNGEIYYVQKETLGQFTGLLDRNGKEIYEGDIIEYIDVKMGGRKTSIIQYDDNCLAWYCTYGKLSNIHHEQYHEGWKKEQNYKHIEKHKFEIIGNIYENPNLINNN